MATKNKAQPVYWKPSVDTLVKAQADEAQMSVSAWLNQLVIEEQARINAKRERDERKQLQGQAK